MSPGFLKYVVTIMQHERTSGGESLLVFSVLLKSPVSSLSGVTFPSSQNQTDILSGSLSGKEALNKAPRNVCSTEVFFFSLTSNWAKNIPISDAASLGDSAPVFAPSASINKSSLNLESRSRSFFWSSPSDGPPETGDHS